MNNPFAEQCIPMKIYRAGLEAEAVKAKSLEKKLRTSDPRRAHIHNVRVDSQRKQIRATNLAYAFMRGKPLRRTENNVLLESTFPANHRKLSNWSRPKWDMVYDLVLDFCNHLPEAMVERAFYDWLQMANLPSSVSPKMQYAL